MKLKNDFSGETQAKSNIVFLSFLTFALIVGVAAYHVFKDSKPTPLNNTQSDSASITLDSNQSIEGEWRGTVLTDNGETFEYTLQLNLNDSEISGWALTADTTGSADALIRGSYHNGTLRFEEYGGTESGDWEGLALCFWEVNLELVQSNGEMSLSGTYETIDCGGSGSITLYRPDYK